MEGAGAGTESKHNYHFDPEKHRYTIDGTRVPGVSTIAKVYDHSRPMAFWAANMVVQHLGEALTVGADGLQACRMADGTTIPLNEENYKRIFAEAKKAHEVFTHKAADAGIRLHSAAEKFCLNEPQVIDPDIQDQFDDFRRWAEKYQMRPLYTERMVFCEKYMFAGQFDLMCMLTIPDRGEVCFEVDFKSSKRVYDSHAIQAAGYKIAHDDQYGPMIEEIGVLVMPRVGTGLVWADCSGYLPQLEKAFMDCLSLYQSMKPVAALCRKLNK